MAYSSKAAESNRAPAVSPKPPSSPKAPSSPKGAASNKATSKRMTPEYKEDTTQQSIPVAVPKDAPKVTPKVTPKATLKKGGRKNQFNLSMAEGDDIEVREHSLVTKCIAEFVCTLIFVFVGTIQGAGVPAIYGDNIVHAAFAHGVTIFVLAAAFGGISGAHINPAITLGITAVGRLNPIHAVCYAISQLTGGFVGALITRACISQVAYDAIQGGATLCAKDVYWYQGLIIEVMTTFMLVQTVLLTAVDTSSNMLAPLAIGFTLVIDIFAGGNISGASMNPARSFGPNVVAQLFANKKVLGAHFWSWHFIYYVGPIVGALLAAALYRTFFARDTRAIR